MWLEQKITKTLTAEGKLRCDARRQQSNMPKLRMERVTTFALHLSNTFSLDSEKVCIASYASYASKQRKQATQASNASVAPLACEGTNRNVDITLRSTKVNLDNFACWSRFALVGQTCRQNYYNAEFSTGNCKH